VLCTTETPVLRLIARRLAHGALTLMFVAVAIFFVTAILPGDAAMAVLGQDATAESLAVVRERLGLDQPLLVRFAVWARDVASGNLGVSFGTAMPVAPILLDRLWNSLRLAALAATMSFPTGFLLGMLSAARPGSMADRSVGALALGIVSIPEFFVGLLLAFLFAVKLGLFPAISFVRPDQAASAFLRASFLPALTLALSITPHLVRMTRAAVVSGLTSAYVETAILKGLSRHRIIWRHVLPNVIGPLTSIGALALAYFVAGAVVVETVFAFPGLGRLLVDAVAAKDTPVIQACALLLACVYVIINMAADILGLLANPRLRDQQ
jgi:peptide/nickel transport system permease protein